MIIIKRRHKLTWTKFVSHQELRLRSIQAIHFRDEHVASRCGSSLLLTSSQGSALRSKNNTVFFSFTRLMASPYGLHKMNRSELDALATAITLQHPATESKAELKDMIEQFLHNRSKELHFKRIHVTIRRGRSQE